MNKDAERRVANAQKKGVCLSCEKKSKRFLRGLCYACYQASRRAIRSGEITENELKTQGLILDSANRGRKPSNKLTQRLRDRS